MKAGAAGGIEAMVKAINTHINNPCICRTGCYALWNMVSINGKNALKRVIAEQVNEINR